MGSRDYYNVTIEGTVSPTGDKITHIKATRDWKYYYNSVSTTYGSRTIATSLEVTNVPFVSDPWIDDDWNQPGHVTYYRNDSGLQNDINVSEVNKVVSDGWPDDVRSYTGTKWDDPTQVPYVKIRFDEH